MASLDPGSAAIPQASNVIVIDGTENEGNASDNINGYNSDNTDGFFGSHRNCDEGCSRCIFIDDYESDDIDDVAEECFVMPPPKQWNPFLDSFVRFPDLPIEIRIMVWRFTLPSRTVEIDFNLKRGFYSRAKIPVALKVCKDSREAVSTYIFCNLSALATDFRQVIKFYSTCFGSILYDPRVVRLSQSLD